MINKSSTNDLIATYGTFFSIPWADLRSLSQTLGEKHKDTNKFMCVKKNTFILFLCITFIRPIQGLFNDRRYEYLQTI